MRSHACPVGPKSLGEAKRHRVPYRLVKTSGFEEEIKAQLAASNQPGQCFGSIKKMEARLLDPLLLF
jgi:hypothetical protein